MEIEKQEVDDRLVETHQTVLCTDLFTQPQPRLTPTGKISHAKTRVYTQRYRKEWEELRDFKGWLTSVPFQSTRALCIYCKKNLHAHRLSLLKHTCTLKHQRAAAMHKSEMAKLKMNSSATEGKEIDYTAGDFEELDESLIKTNVTTEEEEEEEEEEEQEEEEQEEIEEEDRENDGYEYVVERLEVEGEGNEEVEESYVDQDESNEVTSLQDDPDEPEIKKELKKRKTEPDDEQDALAKAMAHVHGDYTEDSGDRCGIELEMVVETDPAEPDQILPDHVLPNQTDGGNSTNEDENSPPFESVRKSKKNVQIQISTERNASKEIDAGPKKKLVAYQLSASQLSRLTNSGTPSITPKTLTLSSGKTVTLSSGKITTGGRFVLSKMQGSTFPELLMASDKGNRPRKIFPKPDKPISTNAPVAGTSNNDIQRKENSRDTKAKISSFISTHVIDTSKGVPVGGLQVSLYKLMDGRWTFLNESTTTPNGRCADLVDTNKCQVTAGRYKMHFDIDKYFTLRRIETMYPFIEIVFDVKNPTANYHIPVLLSPFGYSTYRGSDR